jgi:single-strand DNA-binding protein
MASVNKVIIVGNLGGAPELRYTPGGKAMARFSLATNEGWTDGDGIRQEHTEWHAIVVWNRQAEPCAQYLAKGSAVYVEGKLRTNIYTDKEGIKRSTTEVVAQRVQFLGTGHGKEAKVPVEVASASDASEWEGIPYSAAADGNADTPF